MPWFIAVNQLAIKQVAFDFTDKTRTSPVNIALKSFNVSAEKTEDEAGITLVVGEKVQLSVNNGQIGLYDLALSTKKQTKSLIKIPSFEVSGILFNLQNQNIEIDKVTAKNAQVRSWLTKKGIVNYETIFAEKHKKTKKGAVKKKEDKDEAELPWTVSINQLAMNDFALDFEDQSIKKPVRFNVQAINLTAEKLTNKKGAKLPFSLALKLNRSGYLKVKGATVVEPFSSQLKVNSKIALNDFQPYIDKFARLDIVSGFFNVNVAVNLAQKKGRPFDVRIKGNSKIDSLVTRDQLLHKDFVKWTQLKLEGLDLNVAQNKYLIKTVKIMGPYARFMIKKDRSTNISDLLIDDATEKKTVVKQPIKKGKATQFKIGAINIVKGALDFSDLSLILPFSAHIQQLNGNVKGISSVKNAITTIKLAGKVADLAPVKIDGKVNVDKSDFDLALDFNSMPLPIVTPYMAEFAGRKIEKGNMSLSLKYKIENKQLSASNSILIDQLELGDEVDSPNAVSLPLGLAIALLEDGDGKIKLDVPITGSLEDPQFSLFDIVFDAFVNVFTKVISSPFSAISSLAGDDEDMSKIVFTAGSAALTESQENKLNGLADALVARPNLVVEIKGRALSAQDWPLLQADALKRQLIDIKVEEVKRDDNKTILAENTVLTDDDYQRLLADLFIQKFPTLADRSLLGTPRLIEPLKGDFYQVANTKLSTIIPPDAVRLQKLATSRSQSIAKYLVEKGITMDRMFLLSVDVDNEDQAEDDISATLNLTVK